MSDIYSKLKPLIQGSLHTDTLTRTLYATDASVYKEMPDAVVYPKDERDIIEIIGFASTHKIPLIPRTAGTSLAGQCVGKGIVVDVSLHMNKILDFDSKNGVVSVQPGVIRDELNAFLKPHGWFFGPNTSTANRCMIGGMTGNNSCGSTSIRYGTTRDKTLKIRAVTANAEVEIFGENTQSSFDEKIKNLLSPEDIRQEIFREFPKPNIHRRNTGYAIDVLARQQPFEKDGENWNIAKLLCGSEGTLAFSTEITLQLDPLPPANQLVIAAHFSSIRSCMEATKIAMTFAPYACELMDKIILDCTKENIEQRENRFFVEGDPAAILAIELRHDNEEELEILATGVINALNEANLGYAFPIIRGDDAAKVWNLRAAGLGLLANLPGPKKALACIEDTAVDLQDLPEYISEFEELMKTFGQNAVYYAHAGAGELHLRPILDLRNQADLEQFRQISEASARLVKKYNGSLSGEHGDGRVRAEFIPIMVGEKNYDLLREVKKIFDPHNILNPGKIIDAPPMDTMLREDPQHPLKSVDTFFDYGKEGFIAATEKCNGSGDCRKLADSGGTMCPSYQATRQEKHTTRGRANALREFISNAAEGKNAFEHEELKEVLDLCLSCKGCTRECPSNVDMAGMKAEWQYQYYQTNKRPLRDYALGHIDVLSKPAGVVPNLINGINNLPGVDQLLKRILGVASQRQLPKFQSPVHRWFDRQVRQQTPQNPRGVLYLFFDEFTNYQDAEVGKAAIKLLWRLGYEVRRITHASSGRSQISKGLLETARKRADQNVQIFHPIVSEQTPLIGIEPSAILGFRDEYPRLVSPELRSMATELSSKVLLIDEFISRELRSGRLRAEDFGQPKNAKVLLHGHCHQKALSGLGFTKDVLKASGYTVEIIPSGCCGMAGSFGYEKEHYQTSMAIGEMVLFPKIRQSEKNQIIIAPGTSCRHQIADGTGRIARHWVEVV
ncbi:MAG: FAD-binding oxidoreductase [Flavobacteriales bacterium]|nr:MAG: FAD-binding oxidoreductase [Flavobacteriales bacterium]